MDYKQLLQNFDDLNEQIKAAKAEMQAKSKGLVEAAANIFLEACPEVTGLHWVQYQPYFNDGESCEFGVHDICFHILTDEDGEIDAYESTEIYAQEDLNGAIKGLSEAEDYQNDPDAWRQNYLKKYREDHGREWVGNLNYLKPYPYDTGRAQDRIDNIKARMEVIDAGTGGRIQKEFKQFKTAMNKIPDDVMETLYGNHVMVVINRDGTETDHFEHD